MNSSMLAGERRWASARRGGMTVLGRVAVPKPLNLPSQRLENHGLDPNVEIVPKGTLSWGSRPSSSGSNPWITSSVSPNAEGGTVSPSHCSGRPSSGESGTRPSTAGSERTHQPVSNAWSSNSRPSSASGTLSSNQASLTSLRPRSAENRPSSSQLSRFADPVSKNSAAWGPRGTAGRSSGEFSKDDEFALSSGDFPTLGSEKDNSMKNTELEGRPISDSCRIAHGKEDMRSKTDAEHRAVDTWRADGFQGVDGGIHPSMEKGNGDTPQYFNPNTAPQHFDTWVGPHPMNGPAGVWYGRGRPQGPPYRVPPVQPGGFPMEPFPYYRPQIAPPPLQSSQCGPIPGPRGPHPKNGDLYRPQIPDAYAYAGMPFRPGFYPGPAGSLVPQGPSARASFEGYYGPPMGSERDIPYMGMAVPPPVYNSTHSGPAPGIGNSHGQIGRGRHPGKTSSEQVDADRVDSQGPKRIHLKSHHFQHDHPRDGDTWEHNPQSGISYPNKNRPHMVSSHDNVWDAEEDPKESAHAKGMPGEKPFRSSDHRVHLMDGVKVKSFDGTGNAKTVNDKWTNASESALSIPAEMSRKISDLEKDSSILTGSKNSFLMHKIDGLNAKIRISDGRNVSPHARYQEKERNRSQVIDAKVKNNMGEVSDAEGLFEKTPRDYAFGPNKVIVPASDKPSKQVTVMSRRPNHGEQSRIDHRGRGKFNNQDSDGWLKKPLTTESFPVITASHDEHEVHGPNKVKEASEYSVSNPVAKIEEALVDTHDSMDAEMKRAKMREIAKQRALQLQKEEEERIKEQRAKALAKLEELNRRTLAGEVGVEKPEKSQAIIENPGEQDESPVVSEPVMANINNANQSDESVVIMPRTLPVEADVTTLPMREDARDVSAGKGALQFTDGDTSRHKRTSYKQKQNSSLQKSFTEKPVSHVASIDIKPNKHPSSEIKSSKSNVPSKVDILAETAMPQRRKYNRSGKNKHKLDEAPLPLIEADINPERESIDKDVIKGSFLNLDTSVVKSIQTDKAVEGQEGLNSLQNEESHGGIASQWRHHSSHRQPRSQYQAYKKSHRGDSVWAPVCTQNKDTKGSVQAGPNSVHESAYPIKVTNHTGQNNLKGRRAEMERYVPKPVAKELAQHGNVPNLSLSVDSTRSKDGSGGEINEGVVAHDKHTKDHGTWNQQSSTDSSHMNGVHNGPSSTYEHFKEVQEPREISESVQGEIDTESAEIRTSGTGRGKRDVARSPTTCIGNNANPDKTFGGEADGNQTDRTIGPIENRASSHWKPKPRLNAANEQSLTTEINRSTNEQRSHTTGQGGNSSQTQPDQPVYPKYRADQESAAAGNHQEIEEKAKGQRNLPNLHRVGPYKASPPPVGNEDVRVAHNGRSGSRRNGRHNSNRLIMGEDNNNSRGDWNPGHDNMPRNAPPFMDNRQRHSVHYEYQPVGVSKNHNRVEKVDELVDGADSSYGKRRERGQSHSRRGGNYSRRQTGPPTHVDLGWE